jgi:hypothetical protein
MDVAMRRNIHSAVRFMPLVNALSAIAAATPGSGRG